MSQNNVQDLVQQLNSPEMIDRLDALKQLTEKLDEGVISRPAFGRDVNNHIHSQYSFSPYSPSKAVWMAYMAGLSTAGIMDHDSISGALEFTAAGQIIGLPTTIGAECRASFASTPLAGRRINNPDQDTVAYIAFHGVPHSQTKALSHFFKPVARARGIRNRKMTKRLNELLAPAGIAVDYDKDVLPLSLAVGGGSVTERHLLFAVAGKLIARFGTTGDLVAFLTGPLKIEVSDKMASMLTDQNNPHQAYDLLGLLKSDLVEKFYLPATDECPPIAEVAAFARMHGIVLAYPYLGDITSSVTGDKKAQTFEDSYLDELFEVIKANGFNAVTYMPSRNTREQLIRLRSLCDKHGLFQISGEDINQPRQKFICEAMRDPMFSNLFDAAWALIGHERLASEQLAKGMFSSQTTDLIPALTDRIVYFRDAAMKLYEKDANK